MSVWGKDLRQAATMETRLRPLGSREFPGSCIKLTIARVVDVQAKRDPLNHKLADVRQPPVK